MINKEIIHIVLGKANPERMNGVNKVVYQLATEQAASGRQVSVWGITANVENNFKERNFDTRLFVAQKQAFKIDVKLKEAIIAKKDKAIFHIHGGWIPAFATLSGIFAANKAPFVITPHGAYNTIALQRSKWIKKLYFHFFEKALLSRAMRIHCIGQSEVSGTNKLYPNHKTFLLPYGFEPGALPVKQYTTSQDPFIIGFLGRLDIYTKGLDLLLEAFAVFHKQEPNARLWIVGDSNERAQLEKMIAEQGLQEVVILWGSKFGKEKDNLILKMDLFVHPSRNEGLPASVLEASAMGIPSIVSKATNIGAYIDEYQCGISIEDENIEALTNALIALKRQWDTDHLQVMGNNARRMVTSAFNWHHIVDEMDKLYQE